MKTTWIANTVMILGVIIVLILANFPLLMSMFGPVPFYYTNLPFPTNQRFYMTEDRISFSMGQCNSQSNSVAVVSVKEFYNTVTGDVISLPPGSRIIPPGCTTFENSFANLFPPNLEDGNYVIRGVTTFRGQTATIDVAWQTQGFIYRRTRNE